MRILESRMEHKRIVQASNGTVATAGALIYYAAISQDDTISGRTGDKINPTELLWTFGYSDTATGIARMIIFQDTSNTGAAPSVTDVLSSATPQAHLNTVYNLQKRFRVLVDRTITTSAAGEQYVNLRGRVTKLSPIYFNGTGATSASGGKNALYVLIIGGQATGGYAINLDLAYTDA